MDFSDFFSPHYAAARTRFLEHATAAGAHLAHYAHPEQSGPNGEALGIDVAHLGNRNGARQLVVISGTHGLEAYAGSAAQIAWLKLFRPQALAHDVGVLLIHGLNPYGFAHFTRTTENNVDLNRNFIDHAAPPENPDYSRLHPHLIATDWSFETQHALTDAEAGFRAEYGADALFNARVKGQYAHPDGPYFGGHQREWSNLTLERIVDEHLASAARVGLIDWHTGLGDYAQPFFLCFSPEDSEHWTLAKQWWGAERIENARPHGLARPAYVGLVFQGLQHFLGARPLVGAVVEFGTRGTAMNHAQALDQWLRKQDAAFRRTDRHQQLLADLRDAYVPVAQTWRNAVIHQGVAITDQALAGLTHWPA